MYALLVVFGTIIATAGVALVGSGISVQDHTFDPSIITPGMVGLVGGFLLIGFGLAVRQLIRIEHTLALRPIGGNIHAELTPVVVAAAEPPSAPPAIPVSVNPPVELAKPVIQQHEAAAVATASLTPAAQEAERLREKFPSLLRLEPASVVEETGVALLPNAAVRVEEETVEAGNVAVIRHVNGGAFAKVTPQNEAGVRPSGKPDRSKNFDALWPRRKRSGQGAQIAVVQPAVAEPVNDVSPNAEPEIMPGAPTPISVLKSGVVDGMAYTLYSDGSIEAQLPQGTLRFGSIADLRNHIEQHAS
jgi:hypothetical protein